MKAKFDLKIHDVLHRIVLGTRELFLLRGTLVDLLASLQQVLRAQEGPKVLRAEGRIAVQFRGHDAMLFVFWSKTSASVYTDGRSFHSTFDSNREITQEP